MLTLNRRVDGSILWMVFTANKRHDALILLVLPTWFQTQSI